MAKKYEAGILRDIADVPSGYVRALDVAECGTREYQHIMDASQHGRIRSYRVMNGDSARAKAVFVHKEDADGVVTALHRADTVAKVLTKKESPENSIPDLMFLDLQEDIQHLTSTVEGLKQTIDKLYSELGGAA